MSKTESGKKLGPNMRRLVINKMAMDAIPNGTTDGLAAGIEFLKNPSKMLGSLQVATEWAKQAVELIRTAKGPNPWKGKTDEEIAGDLLRQIDERRRAQRA